MNYAEATVWGRHAVLEALRAGTARTVYIAQGQESAATLSQIRQAASKQSVPIREVPAGEIRRRVGDVRAQGVIALIRPSKHVTLGDVLTAETARSSNNLFFLVLDQIQDPHNLGALIRTSDGAGVHAVVVPERRSAALTGVIAKTSAGAIHHVPVVEVKNLARALQELKEAGIWIVGLDGGAKQTLFQVDLSGPVALVVGGEGEGLRRLTRDRCDYLVRLPMFGQVESLNASVAGSIALYEVVRQRAAAAGPTSQDRTVE